MFLGCLTQCLRVSKTNDSVNDFARASAGTLNYNFAIATKDLVRASSGIVADLKRV